MKSLSLRPWLWWMPAVAILIAGIGWTTHRFVKRTLEADLRDEVLTVLNANVAALDIWLDTQSRLAAVMAADPSVRDPILSLVSQPPVTPSPMTNNRPGGRRFAPLTPLQSEVQSGLDSRLRSAGYGAALVLGTNLQVMATSQRARNRLGETLDGGMRCASNRHSPRDAPPLSCRSRPDLVGWADAGALPVNPVDVLPVLGTTDFRVPPKDPESRATGRPPRARAHRAREHPDRAPLRPI
jgi:hypothetical protein